VGNPAPDWDEAGIRFKPELPDECDKVLDACGRRVPQAFIDKFSVFAGALTATSHHYDGGAAAQFLSCLRPYLWPIVFLPDALTGRRPRYVIAIKECA